MDARTKHEELNHLKARIKRLEAELAEEDAAREALTSDYYPVYSATTGSLLGIFGAAASLLFNIVGSLAAGKNPLELVRIYLTFPLGEQALQLSDRAHAVYAVPDGVMLAMGCCLYVGTGMLLGIPINLALTRLTPRGSLYRRLLVGSVVSLCIWIINFYGILSWLQPLLFGGNWIVQLVPWWVAAATHLVFGWTIVLLYRLGEYTPYRLVTASHAAQSHSTAPAA
jgi:hypothetical protein